MSAGPALLALTASALLVVCGTGIALVSWRSADELVHPAREPPGDAPALPHERIAFAASDGIALRGWWIPADDAKGVVVFLHGYGESKDQALPLLPALHAARYHVLAYDARAHGESEGNATTVGMDEVADVHGALRVAAERAPALPVALVGWSMGGATAINAAARSHVDAVVVDSAFATLENIASNSITKFTDLPQYPFGPLSVEMAGWMVQRDVGDNAPVEAMRDVRAPVLVIQGLADDIVLADDDGRALAAAAPEGSASWFVPGAAHVGAHALAPRDYEARVVGFLDEHLMR